MYSIVYVLTDNSELKMYQELMKSLISLRMHMPEKKVIVLTDTETYQLINDKEIMDMAIVRSIDTPSDFSVVERSRFIKTKAREFIVGDMLVIDTDTVICKPFPERISNSDISAAYDINHPERNNYGKLIIKVSERSGIKLDFDKFLNSGVVWSRDTEAARLFYKQWAELWNKTRVTGINKDQPAFDHVVYHNKDIFELLDGHMNCQMMPSISNVGTPMGLFANAYIIHYFHDQYNPYAIGNEKYKDLPYDDEKVIQFLENPYTSFVRCRLVEVDEEGLALYKDDKLQKTEQYWFIGYLNKKHKKIFNFNEKVIADLKKLKGKLSRKK